LADRKPQAATVARLSKQLRARIAIARRPPKGVRQINFKNRRRVR
jgi:hypothetical protein